MKCILHIGTEKTGTTLLQNWLYSNRDALSAQGIFLSDRLRQPNNRLLPAYFQSHLDDWAKRNRIRTLEEKDAYFDGFLERLRDELKDAAASHHAVIISSEHFHSRVDSAEDIQALAGFLNDIFDSVTVSCYFRNQFDMALSYYSTQLKISGTATLADCMARAKPENYYYDFLSIADNWSSAFGRENCEFRIYDRSKFSGNDLRTDFLDAIDCGIDKRLLDFSIETANESLTALESAAYRAVNASIPYWNDDKGGTNRLNNRTKRVVSDIGALKQGAIQSQLRAEIENRFKACNDVFFARYFDCTNEFIDIADTIQPNPVLPMEKVEEIVFGLLAATLPALSNGSHLRGRDANDLRDLAIRMEEHSLEDALMLMRLAQRARPHGRFITRKIKDYEARLAAQRSRN